MFNTNPISVLAEAASMDMSVNTSDLMTEGAIINAMRSIEEVNHSVSADMVPVIPIGDDYLVEMNYLMPFMRDNNIHSVAEALDSVAEANCLPTKSVGLLIESDDTVTAMIEKATGKAKKSKDPTIKKRVLKKVSKVTNLANTLKDKGYTVKKKASNK